MRLLLPVEAALHELAGLNVGQNDAARLLRGQAVLIRGRDAPIVNGAAYAHLQRAAHRRRRASKKANLQPTRVFNFGGSLQSAACTKFGEQVIRSQAPRIRCIRPRSPVRLVHTTGTHRDPAGRHPGRGRLRAQGPLPYLKRKDARCR